MKMNHISLALPDAMRAKLEELAAKNNCTIQDIIRYILNKEIK